MMMRYAGIGPGFLGFVVALSLLGCGGKDVTPNGARSTGGAVGSGGARATGGAVGSGGRAARVPAHHRVAGSSCTEARAAINPTPADPMCDSANDSACAVLFTCTQDSDCTAGVNGRCSSGSFGPRRLFCSYDACQSDSDCPDTEPCECRSAAADTMANVCMTTSNCRVDADCGDNGYCSPSQTGGGCVCPSPALCTGDSSCSPGPCACGDACGHGYFCHTPADTCIDDSDCGTSGTCNYDSVNQRWSCSECWPIP